MPTPLASADAFTGPSFSVGNRLARVAWGVVSALLFRTSPRPFHAWRALLLRLFGAQLGRGCHIYPGAQIWGPWNLVCADEVGIANGVIIYNQATITLGRRCVISQGTHLCTGTHDYRSPRFTLFARPIVVGELAWVAAECFVHPGVTIGDGVVVGARSVVTKDLPPWTVCAGHPCQVLKPRSMEP